MPVIVELWPDASNPIAQMYFELDPKKLSSASEAESRLSSGSYSFLLSDMAAANVAMMAALMEKEINSEKALSIWL